MKFTGLFNVTGHPAITINAGFINSKLPVGLQLVGGCFEDKKMIEAAMEIEHMLSNQ